MMTLRIETDDRGITLITIDVPQRSMNVLTPELVSELGEAIEHVATTASIKGAIITSAKTSGFLAGADLTDLVNAYDSHITPSQGSTMSQRISRLYRRLETCGKPIAAAINGLALGGGFELCLACHYRVINDGPKAFVGLPEVKVGLLPGAGGTQRLPRLVGIPMALPWLLKGSAISPAEALGAGLVDAVVPADDLIENARTWLLTQGNAVQPWDRKGFSVPNGAGPLAPHAMQTFVSGTALITGATGVNYPAPLAILSSVFEGTQVAIDVGLRIESKYFGKLLAGPVARNLMRTLFVSKANADKLLGRPSNVAKLKVAKIGVLGASPIGKEIALLNAGAGIEVVWLDPTAEAATSAKAALAARIAADVATGKLSQAAGDSSLNRIFTTSMTADLAGVDFVVEALADSSEASRDLIQHAEKVLSDVSQIAFTSSGSMHPDSIKSLRRPANAIGLHFVPPIADSSLMEIIRSSQSSDASVARMLDYVAQLRKTPLVVDDYPSSFVSRVMATFLQEGQKMIEEGVAPALVENAAKSVGFSTGPLEMSDDVTLSLQQQTLCQQDRDRIPEHFKISIGRAVIDRMIDINRPGRGIGGFYEYAAKGPKRLWAGLNKAFPQKQKQPTVAELGLRLLTSMALESARCLEEGVICTETDADIGSVVGVGYPSWTGGTLSYIDTIGLTQFIRDCRELAPKCGPRFGPPEWLLEKQRLNRTFYPAQVTVAPATVG
jgi:3-hydroxyacyl-CoA dehydrogenase/enoyl-CoA hydratase/3-hydroxybutyryl-CoA epimerase